MNVLTKRAALFIVATLVIGFAGGCSSGGGDDSDGGDGSQLSGSCAVKVYNGQNCNEGQGPVALLKLRNAPGSYFAICSGAFIAQRFVLTAAHCFADSGAYGATVSSGSDEAESVAVSVHPLYRASSGRVEPSPYDVAIVELERPLGVETLPLLTSNVVLPGDLLNIIGFGVNEDDDLDEGVTVDRPLRKGEMQIAGNQDGLIVAVPINDGQTVCEGDSGSPGIVKNHNGVPAIAGVTSVIGGDSISGLDSCQDVSVAGFVDVQLRAVMDFIKSKVPQVATI